MIDPKMPADQFERLIAPLYRQFLGYLRPAEMAQSMADYYRKLGHFPPGALTAAVDTALETIVEQRMPTIAWIAMQCKAWIIAQHGGMVPPKRMSEQCVHCSARVGVGSNGRLAVLHEPSCVDYDAEVRPLTEQVA